MNLDSLNSKIAVCIVNWNGEDHLKYSLTSLQNTSYNNIEFYLIDNDSSDNSLNYVVTNFPNVQVIKNTSNLMWAGGNNVGIQKAIDNHAEWVLLANNDILVEPRWAKVGMFIAQRDSDIGIIGFNVIGESEKQDVEIWYDACKQFKELEFCDSKAIAGCFMLVSIKVFKSIGLIDEIYRLYAEDSDLELRAKRAGFRIVRCNLPIWHCSEGTSKKIPIFSSYMAIRNGLRLCIKHHNYNYKDIFIWFLTSVSIALNFKYKRISEGGYSRRLRPTNNPIFNLIIVFRALVWNLFYLQKTRNLGLIDQAMCNEVKRTRI